MGPEGEIVPVCWAAVSPFSCPLLPFSYSLLPTHHALPTPYSLSIAHTLAPHLSLSSPVNNVLVIASVYVCVYTRLFREDRKT